jgi:hypothetical protein
MFVCVRLCIVSVLFTLFNLNLLCVNYIFFYLFCCQLFISDIYSLFLCAKCDNKNKNKKYDNKNSIRFRKADAIAYSFISNMSVKKLIFTSWNK